MPAADPAASSPPTGRSTRGRRTPTQRRTMSVALDLFAVHGVSGTSLQMIADALGVTKAAVYHQFRTKDELVAAVAEVELVKLEAALAVAEAEPDRERALEVLVIGMIDVAIEHRRLWSMMQNDPVVIQVLLQQATFRDLMERQFRVLVGPDATPAARVPAALIAAAVAGGVIHPLVADLDDNTLRYHLLQHVRHLAGLSR